MLPSHCRDVKFNTNVLYKVQMETLVVNFEIPVLIWKYCGTSIQWYEFFEVKLILLALYDERVSFEQVFRVLKSNLFYAWGNREATVGVKEALLLSLKQSVCWYTDTFIIFKLRIMKKNLWFNSLIVFVFEYFSCVKNMTYCYLAQIENGLL